MADFDLDELFQANCDCGVYAREPIWSLWCLSHNFDVVGAILAMAELSWEQGFDAGREIKSFIDRGEAIEDNRHTVANYPLLVPVGPDSGN